MNTTKSDISLYMEANPNPNSLKFVANYFLVEEGKSYDFPDVESAENAPLAQELFKLDYVTRVFYMNNFVTVTKTEETEWMEVQNEVRDCIYNHLSEKKSMLLADEIAKTEADEDDSEIVQEIKSILNDYIRPAVEMDGGAISFHSYDEGIVRVLLQGACSGCPSSTITLKAGIENLLKSKLPEVKAVEAEGI